MVASLQKPVAHPVDPQASAYSSNATKSDDLVTAARNHRASPHEVLEVVSGLAGALIPLILRSLGADPATASAIFLTTATDVASMGLFLSLATIFVR